MTPEQAEAILISARRAYVHLVALVHQRRMDPDAPVLESLRKAMEAAAGPGVDLRLPELPTARELARRTEAD